MNRRFQLVFLTYLNNMDCLKIGRTTFGNFHDMMLDHYESDNQITFFVPNDEEQYTLDELTDILI